VPLNFQGALGEVWEGGYINPYLGPLNCNFCDGSGYNAATKQIAEDFYGLVGPCRGWSDKITQDEVQALVDRNCLVYFTHTCKPGEGWKRRKDGYIPTAKEVNAHQHCAGLGGHDAINRYILIETRAKRLGVFGSCPVCKDEGTLPHLGDAIREHYEEWEKCEPPTGTGCQLWEDCFGESPVSPVFASVEELEDWCAENSIIFTSEKTSHED
jgi:hypothetical protein